MSGPKRKMLFGIWVSLALALLLAPAAGAAATPPPPPDWDSEEDRTANRAPALADPPPASTLSEGAAPDGSMAPAQTTQTCPIDTNFDTMPAGWQAQAGTWYTENGNLFTTGIPSGLASISAPGSYFNYSFEARMLRAGCDNCLASRSGLLIAGIPTPLLNYSMWYKSVIFWYTRHGWYSIFDNVPGHDPTPIRSAVYSGAINQGDAWNILRVDVINKDVVFYINNFQVYSASAFSVLRPGQVGIGMDYNNTGTNNRLWVDYARLCLLGHLSYLPGVLQP